MDVEEEEWRGRGRGRNEGLKVGCELLGLNQAVGSRQLPKN